MKHAWLLALALLVAGIVPAMTWGEMTGQQIFDRNCSHCHAAGKDRPGTLQLAKTRGEDRAVLTEREDLAAEYVRYVVGTGCRPCPASTPAI
jgi:mono/diheme cytochrome c family protein